MLERVKNRITSLITDTDECIHYPYLNTDGYGDIQHNVNKIKKHLLAHRASYIIYNGELNPEEIVRHTCDNPSCINPKHLLKGTHFDNVQDRVNRKRSAIGSKNGRYIDGRTLNKLSKTHHHSRKLTFDQVREILQYLKDKKTCKEIANLFNVKESLIRDISSGRTYKQVER